MWYSKDTTLWKLMVVAAIISVAGAMTLTDWGSWAAIIATIVVVTGALWALFGRRIFQRIYYKSPFKVEPRIRTQPLLMSISETKNIEIELTAKRIVNVRFMVFSFEGKGIPPKIENTYEWNMPDGYKSKYIEYIPLDNAWNWTYHPPILKKKTESIRIGLSCLAQSVFVGHLKVYIACIETDKRDKPYELPFNVVK